MQKTMITLLSVLLLSGCATTLKSLEDKKGAVYTEQYEAPIELVFKVAQSVAYRSPCSASGTIYADELRYQIYSIFRLYGMIPEYIWLISMERTSENFTKVDISWSPYVLSEGCFTKNFFDEVKFFLSNPPNPPD